MLCGACWQETKSETTCTACGAVPLLDGRYRLDKKLGQGASGIAFAATRVADGIRVCVKGLSFRGMSSFDAEKLFRREASVLRQIRHPQVPAYIDDFALGAGPSFTLYLVQELVDGQDLEAERAERRPTTKEVVAIADELLAIVAHLHDLAPPIVHRDIKLRNVMRRKDGKLVLVDFGAVKEVVHVSFDPGLSVQGTFGYMAPEQLSGEASPKSDLYAIGMVAVALFSGLEPSAMMRASSASHDVEWERHVAVAHPLIEWLRKMTAAEPANRHRDAAAARAALARAVETREAPEPRREPRSEPASPWPSMIEHEPPPIADEPPKKSGRLAIGFAAAVALLIGGLVLSGKKKEVGGYSSVAAVPAVACDGPCRPVSVPFKDKLRFGMSLDEAKAARPDVANAWSPDDADPLRYMKETHMFGWLPANDPELPTTRLCMASELVGKDANCCLDFFHGGLGRLSCASDFGYRLDELRAMIDKVARLYGPPASYSFDQPNDYLVFVSKPTVWSSDGELEIDFTFGDPEKPGPSSDHLGIAGATMSQRVVMKQTSGAYLAAAQTIEDARRRASAAAAAAAEAARQKELERQREERRKLGLPPEPL